MASEQSLTDRKTIPSRTANGNCLQTIALRPIINKIFEFDVFYIKLPFDEIKFFYVRCSKILILLCEIIYAFLKVK